MNRGSKVLFGIIFLLIVLSVSATFYKAVIIQDFEIIIIDHGEDESSEELPESSEMDGEEVKEVEEKVINAEGVLEVDSKTNTENQYVE